MLAQSGINTGKARQPCRSRRPRGTVLGFVLKNCSCNDGGAATFTQVNKDLELEPPPCLKLERDDTYQETNTDKDLPEGGA